VADESLGSENTVAKRVIKDLCGKLDAMRVPYMITGSIAMNLYAQPRSTRDVDIVVDFEPGDERAVMQTFGREYFVDENAARDAIAKRKMFNMVNMQSLFKIDFVVRKKSNFEHHQFCRRKRLEFDDIEAWVISKEDLILAKMVWAKDSMSEKQLLDVKNLLQTGCDLGYVQKWVTTLRLEAVYAKAQV